MAKLTLNTLSSLTAETSALNTINNNNTAVKVAVENTLSRDGTSPNNMNASIDMNSNRIINLPKPINSDEPMRVAEGLALQTGSLILPLKTANGGLGLDASAANGVPYFTTGVVNFQTFPIHSPIFLLFTGQSNFTQTPSYSWTPATNLKVWNNVVNTIGSTGTAFVSPSATVINAATKMASDIARANPTCTVYMLNVSYDSQPIAQWKTGAGSPDVYAEIHNNISAALTAAGVTKIDGFMWWQGDADRLAYQNYMSDFDTVMARFEAETWFTVGTPKFIWGIASSLSTSDVTWDNMNRVLQATAASKPFDRQFFAPTFLASSYWTGGLAANHMSGDGYFLAGQAAAASWLRGVGVQVLENIGVDTLTANIGMGTVPDIARLAIAKGASLVRSMPSPYTISDNRDALLHLQGADGFSTITTMDAWGTGSIPWISLRAARGTSTTPTATQTNDYLSVLSGDGYGSSVYSAGAGQFAIQAAENFTNTANGTKASIRLTPIGSTSASRTDRFTVLGNGNVGLYGSTSGNTLIAPAAVASGTWTLPATTDTFVGKATTDVLLNKTIGTGGLIFTNATSGSITLTPPVGALGSVTLTMPAATTNLVGTDTTQNLTNKTYNGNTWTAGTGTLTLAASKTITVNNTLTFAGTDGTTLTFAGSSGSVMNADNTATMTNKTYDTAGAGNVFKINGVTISAVTGTGSNVLATSPSIATPTVTGLLTTTGGQIQFPASQVASANVNTLDDYVEGTATPVLAFGGASVGITYSTQTLSYTKIGNLVTVWINLVLTSKGSSTGTATITGLPFTAGDTAIFSIQGNGMNAAVTTQITANVVSGGTTIGLQKFAAGSVTNLANTDFTGTDIVRITGSYRV